MLTPACRPRLYGVGVGPGDPSLMTLRAVHVLRAAEVILLPAPQAGDGPGRAQQVVLALDPDLAARIRPVHVPMSGITPGQREDNWRAIADVAVTAYESGVRSLAFATIGDPSVYSTFAYLAAEVSARVDGLEVEVVPGITAMQTLAARAGTSLVEGHEVLVLVPATAGADVLRRAAEAADTVVIYKAGSRLGATGELLASLGWDDVVIGTDLGTPDETVTRQPTRDLDNRAPYFSTLMLTPERGSTP